MLTKKEEKLLYLLIKHIDSHVSEEQMQKEIWENENVADSTIRVLIKRLREKLGYEDAIINLKGRGYKIIPNI
jgi:DNA-binding response OmpR family regulator